MPIYEFRCDSCGEVFEHLAMSAGDQLEVQCPHCQGQELSRVMSACAAHISDSVSAGGGSMAGPAVQNRTCADSGSCTTITLPGHTRD